MKTQQERKSLIIRAGKWVGAVAGSGLGIFFTFITIFNLDTSPAFSGISRQLFPVLLAIGGAILGWFAFGYMARMIISGKLGFFLMMLKGMILGAIFGGLMLVLLGEIFYASMELWGIPHFTGRIPAMLFNVFAYMGLIGGMLGAMVGLLFGIFAGLLMKKSK